MITRLGERGVTPPSAPTFYGYLTSFLPCSYSCTDSYLIYNGRSKLLSLARHQRKDAKKGDERIPTCTTPTSRIFMLGKRYSCALFHLITHCSGHKNTSICAFLKGLLLFYSKRADRVGQLCKYWFIYYRRLGEKKYVIQKFSSRTCTALQPADSM